MKIVCMGDSLTYGYNVPGQYGWVAILAAKTGWDIVNCGVCGETTGDMRRRFAQDVLTAKPDVVILMGGANDILLDVPAQVTKNNLLAMIDSARTAHIRVALGTTVLTTAESCAFGWQQPGDVERHNSNIRELRQWILEKAGEYKLPCLDFYEALRQACTTASGPMYDDGAHPSIAGYAVLAREALAVLTREGLSDDERH